jgi:hypothetical protein
MSSTIAPLFKGNDYALWSVRIKSYIMSLGCDIWKFVEDGYIAPGTTPTDTSEKKLCNGKEEEVLYKKEEDYSIHSSA